MTPMPTIHAYTITGDLNESVKLALAHYTTRSGRFPTAAFLHPDRIPPDWPTAWPPVHPNAHLNRNLIGLATTEEQPLLL